MIWAAHFALLYSFAALACGRGFADATLAGVGVVAAVVIASSALALAALAALALVARRRFAPSREGRYQATFLRTVALAGAALSAIAIVFNAMAGLMLPPCL